MAVFAFDVFTVIVALPTFLAVTLPPDVTEATVESLLLHEHTVYASEGVRV